MKLKFKQFYQGECVYPHAYSEGQEAEIADDVAMDLVARGIADEVKPAKKGADHAKK